MVKDALPDFVGSCTLVAITETGVAELTNGARYSPSVEMLPGPLRLQLTAEFPALLTLAMNCRDAPDCMDRVLGETLTVTPLGGADFPPTPQLLSQNVTIPISNVGIQLLCLIALATKRTISRVATRKKSGQITKDSSQAAKVQCQSAHCLATADRN
jgi:hypothetical protein